MQSRLLLPTPHSTALFLHSRAYSSHGASSWEDTSLAGLLRHSFVDIRHFTAYMMPSRMTCKHEKQSVPETSRTGCTGHGRTIVFKGAWPSAFEGLEA
jgi:hypothetical protein